MAVNRNFLISLYKFPKSHSISAKMLVIGAGKMGKLVFKHLASKGCRKIIVVQAPVEVHILWCIKYHDIFWVMASSRDRAWNVLLALGNIAFASTFADVLIEIQLVGTRTIAKDAELLHQEGAREAYYACSTHTIFRTKNVLRTTYLVNDNPSFCFLHSISQAKLLFYPKSTCYRRAIKWSISRGHHHKHHSSFGAKESPSVYISFLAKLLGETIWHVHDDYSIPSKLLCDTLKFIEGIDCFFYQLLVDIVSNHCV